MIAYIKYLAFISFALSALSNSSFAQTQTLSPGQSSRCLAFPPNSYPGIAPTPEQLSVALNVDTITFVENLQYLSIDASEHSMLGLSQRLVPSERGSTRSLIKAPLAKSNVYQLTQKVFLSPNFDWGGRNEGGKFGFGLAGGSAPTGGRVANDGFTARFMWRGNKDGTATPVVYSYSADRIQNLPYGDNLRLSEIKLPTGKWFEITLEVTTNSETWLSDGSVRAWFDGKPMLNINGIQWQSEGDEVVIDSITYASFYGGGDSSWSPENETYIRFADVCWSTPLPKQRIYER